MPYKVSKRGSQYCVMKADGSTVKCHPSNEKANEHLKALQANVADAGKSLDTTAAAEMGDKMFMPLSQVETAYVTLSATPGQACANCRFFKTYEWESAVSCHLIENWPESILPTGHCNRWEAKPDVRTEMSPIPVVIVEPEEVIVVEGERAQAEDGTDEEMPMMDGKKPATKKKPMMPMDKAKELIETVVGWFSKGIEPLSTDNGFKDLGNNRWVAWWTNTRQDKQKETFSEKSIEEYIQRVDRKEVDLPELWFWHLGFTRHGKADSLAGIGEHAVAIGHYEDVPHAKAFADYYHKQKDLEVSHGFFFRKDIDLVDGVYQAFNTFEISVLPRGRAANPYTSFMEVKEMELTEAKKAELTAILGEEGVKNLLAAAESRSKEKSNDVQEGYKNLPAAPKDEALAQEVKALKDAQETFATKADVEKLNSGIKALTDFLKDAFGNAQPASISDTTQVKEETDPQRKLMADFLQKQGEKGGQDMNGQKSMLDWLVGGATAQEGQI